LFQKLQVILVAPWWWSLLSLQYRNGNYERQCLSILYEHFSNCWYSGVFLVSCGMLRSLDTDFRGNLSVPSSRASLTLEDWTKSQCNLCSWTSRQWLIQMYSKYSETAHYY
jgi:hypothetical protein